MRLDSKRLQALGPERLAELVLDAARRAPDLKSRVMLELAAGMDASALAATLDDVGARWQNLTLKSAAQQTIVRNEIEACRNLIAARLTPHEHASARTALLRLLGRRGEILARCGACIAPAVFKAAAADLGRLIRAREVAATAPLLAHALIQAPQAWKDLLEPLFACAHPSLGAATLEHFDVRADAAANTALFRKLAEIAGDVAAFEASFDMKALATPYIAAEVAKRWLAVNDLEGAGNALARALPDLAPAAVSARIVDFDWESVWIDWLEACGHKEAAQNARWASFEHTLSAERLRAYCRRLPDFEEIAVEERAIAAALGHYHADRALRFLMLWRAHKEAAALILTRGHELGPFGEEAHAWITALTPVYSDAARRLAARCEAQPPSS